MSENRKDQTEILLIVTAKSSLFNWKHKPHLRKSHDLRIYLSFQMWDKTFTSSLIKGTFAVRNVIISACFHHFQFTLTIGPLPGHYSHTVTLGTDSLLDQVQDLWSPRTLYTFKYSTLGKVSNPSGLFNTPLRKLSCKHTDTHTQSGQGYLPLTPVSLHWTECILIKAAGPCVDVLQTLLHYAKIGTDGQVLS